ncbi:MAG: hypothetical protein F9B45_28960 [Phycisphaera sp. RhM]|nr:hypothetical protein [Phycisphaera sp. RhM]
MGRKRKHPHRHTGKIVPLRTAERIKREVETSRGRPKLSVWRDMVYAVMEQELALVNDESDREMYKERTAVLAEVMATLDMIQQRYLHDKNGNPTDVTHEDAEFVTYHALRAGYLLSNAAARVAMEQYAVEGVEHSDRGRQQAERNAARKKKTTRDELLQLCRDFYRLHRCSRRQLAEHVATKLSVSEGRVRQLMSEYKIFKSDYT